VATPSSVKSTKRRNLKPVKVNWPLVSTDPISEGDPLWPTNGTDGELISSKNDINLQGYFDISNFPKLLVNCGKNLLNIEGSNMFPSGELIPMQGTDKI
jgi:hypothetical protein